MARTARTVLQAGVSALVALTLMGGLGLTRAYADPTPTPEPEVTADTSTGTPTPTPAQEAAATPTPTPTAEVTPTAGPTSTAAVPVQAEQDARLPNAVEPSEGHVNLVPNPDDFVDDRFRIDVITRCFDDVPVEITITSNPSQTTTTTLDYLISNDILVNITDSVTIPAAPGSATITVPQTPSSTVYGDLRIELFDDGEDQPFAIQHFDIIYCLDVQTDQCQTISWENDDEIPVTLVYGEGERVGADPADAITAVLPGGFTDRIVRTDWDTFYWYAETELAGAGNNVITERAGEGSGIAVRQDCDPDPLADARARCTPQGGATIFAPYIEHRDGDSYRYVVTNTDGDVVASRTVPDDGTAQAIWEDPLPGVGTYRFRLYLNGSGTAVETKVFEAQFCLVVTKSCQLISFFNPPTNDAVSVEYFIINEDPSGDFVLQPGARQHISWAHFGDMFSLRWGGRTAAGDPAGRGEVTDVPMDCTPSPLPSSISTSPPPDPGPGDGNLDDGLADTGASAGSVLGLGAGLLLIAAGSILLGRRRLTL